MERERNPNAGKWELPNGYTDIGWQKNFITGSPEKKCLDLGHKRREFDNSLFKYRCTDVVTICDECKIVWHTDMSD